jgi:hypothetical protein
MNVHGRNFSILRCVFEGGGEGVAPKFTNLFGQMSQASMAASTVRDDSASIGKHFLSSFWLSCGSDTHDLGRFVSMGVLPTGPAVAKTVPITSVLQHGN